MPRRLTAALVGAVAVATVLVVGAPSLAGATFGSSTRSTATVRAAADWTAPTVALAAPAAVVQGTVTLSATASDADSAIASVAVQHAGPNGTWTTVCTDTTSPYTCAWDTRTVADGSHQLRAVATDTAGVSATSTTVSTQVANTATVVLAAPARVVRGTVPLTATVSGPGAWSVRFEHAAAGTTSWKVACTDATAPHTCDWSTTALVDGTYSLRAVASAGGVTLTSAVVSAVTVDNTAPVVTMQDPGSPLRGTVALGATATDATSGVASVTIQYAPQGSTAYRDGCTVTDKPFTCALDTTKLADGSWSFRAVATDVAGTTSTSTAVTGRTVDNVVSTVTLADPGAVVRGSVPLTATATSTAGVTSVRLQRAPAGGSTWTDVCTDTSAPYTCAWNTTALADGLYDLRAVLLDSAGRTTVSAVVAGRRVDNAVFRGVDVQATNGGGTAGRPDAGDVVTYTFSHEVDPASIMPGWNGSATDVVLRIRDGAFIAGQGSDEDLLDVLRAGDDAPVGLGVVDLGGDYVIAISHRSAATMVAGTTTLDGRTVTTVTVTLDRHLVTGGLRYLTSRSTMTWAPAAAISDLWGRGISPAVVTESGALDREF